jgi:hypothetical protein
MTELIFANRVVETAFASGTGPFSLQNRLETYYSRYSEKFQIGSAVTYCALYNDLKEIGYGVLTSENQLTRVKVYDSSTPNGFVNSSTPGNPSFVDFPDGAQITIFNDIPAQLLVLVGTNGELVNPGPIRNALFVANTTALKALIDVEDEDKIFVVGNGLFVYDAEDATAPDNVDTFRLDGESTGLFKRNRLDIQGDFGGSVTVDASASSGAILDLYAGKKATYPTRYARWLMDASSNAIRLAMRWGQESLVNFMSVFSNGDNSDRIEFHKPIVLPSKTNANGLKNKTLSWLSGASKLIVAWNDAANNSTESLFREIPLVKGGYFVGSYPTISDLKLVEAAEIFETDVKAWCYGFGNAGDCEPFAVQWAPLSTLSADDVNVFRPVTGSASSGNGRWLRLAASKDVTFTSGVAAPSVKNKSWFITSGSTALTDFADEYEGQIITIQRGDADITIVHDPAKIDLGGFNRTLTLADPRATFRSIGGVWQSIGGRNQVDDIKHVLNDAALKNMPTGQPYFVRGKTNNLDGGEGLFLWVSGDQSANVTNDPGAGVWVAPAAQTGSLGAWKLSIGGVLRPERYGAVDLGTNGAFDSSVALSRWLDGCARNNVRGDARGKTYYGSKVTVTCSWLDVDNIVIREYNPNPGYEPGNLTKEPQTVTITSSSTGSGYVNIGSGFKIDRNGNGSSGSLNYSWGLKIYGFGRVDCAAEVYGNSRGSGIWYQICNNVTDNSYVHHIRHNNDVDITDDIIHGVWMWGLNGFRSFGRVEYLGGIDQTRELRDSYNRGYAVSGSVDGLMSVNTYRTNQAIDITGDLYNGNRNITITGSNIRHSSASAVKAANGQQNINVVGNNIEHASLCAVLIASPGDDLAVKNMTSNVIIANNIMRNIGSAYWWHRPASEVVSGVAGHDGHTAAVYLNNNSTNPLSAGYPRGVVIEGNRNRSDEGAATFTVADATNGIISISSAVTPFVAGSCVRVRLTTTGTLPSGLATGTNYWLIDVSSDNATQYKLASTFRGAEDGIAITAITGGSGTHTISIQPDCQYGVWNDQSAGWDKLNPNRERGNQWGNVSIAALFQDLAGNRGWRHLKAVLNSSVDQSVANSTQTGLLGDTVPNFSGTSSTQDPYGLVALNPSSVGYSVFVVPFSDFYTVTARATFDGHPVGQRQLAIQYSTNNGSDWTNLGNTPQIAGAVPNGVYTVASGDVSTASGGGSATNLVGKVIFNNDWGSALLSNRTTDYLPAGAWVRCVAFQNRGGSLAVRLNNFTIELAA